MSDSRKIIIKGTGISVDLESFIYNRTMDLDLRSWVRKTTEGVELILHGKKKILDEFENDIRKEVSKVAVIKEVKETDSIAEYREVLEITGIDKEFNKNSIIYKAICDKCLNDINGKNLRYANYPFISCSQCGPRFTLVDNFPYTRDNITMRSYVMCSECRKEYENAEHKRHDVQAICCSNCGPMYTYEYEIGFKAIQKAVSMIMLGGVVAVKEWGGFSLMGNAEKPEAIKEIRKKKQIEDKPIAVIARSMDVIEKHCIIKEEEKELIQSVKRPMLLLKKKSESEIGNMLAPDNGMLGVMLPCSGIHHIILKLAEIDLLATTSLNLPLAPMIRNSEMAKRHYKDSMLDNDLYVAFTSDNSIVKTTLAGPVLVKRDRGYVPGGIKMPFSSNLLASGGCRDISFCFTKEDMAYPSHYLAVLVNSSAQDIYRNNIRKWERIWEYEPKVLVCDMCPDYQTTKIFENYSIERKLPLIKVQHHHAHLASCAAENNIDGDIIGVAFDGVGYGEDGILWGGEFMSFDYFDYKRIGSLKPIPFHKGDKDLSKTAISSIIYAGLDCKKVKTLERKEAEIEAIEKKIKMRMGLVLTSSANTLFDAIAAIIGVVEKNTFYKRSTMVLESLVRKEYLGEKYGYNILIRGDNFEVDTSFIVSDVVADLVKGVDISKIASKFHYTMAAIIVDGICKVKENTGISRVCVSGEVFTNYYLAALVSEMLKDKKIEFYKNEKVSSTDNGLSYGQAVVGAANSVGKF